VFYILNKILTVFYRYIRVGGGTPDPNQFWFINHTLITLTIVNRRQVHMVISPFSILYSLR